jgi:hypothetical protein
MVGRNWASAYVGVQSRTKEGAVCQNRVLLGDEQIKQKATDDDMHSDMPRADQTKGY